MTAKRTHGACTCGAGAMLTAHAEGRITLADPGNVHHDASCPSLYHAQHEPDALTRLCKLVRQRWTVDADDRPITDVLDLISEAREEQRKARNDGIRAAAMVCREEGQSALAACVEDLLPQPEDV